MDKLTKWFHPWKWYYITLLAMLTVVCDILIYGGFGPYLLSQNFWPNVFFGFILMGPVGLALNIFLAMAIINKLKFFLKEIPQ